MPRSFDSSRNLCVALALISNTGCGAFALHEPPDPEEVHAEIQRVARDFLVESLGDSIVDNMLKLRSLDDSINRGTRLTYQFTNPAHTDFTTPIHVVVSPEGRVEVFPPLPPCADDSKLCVDLLPWYEIVERAHALRFPLRGDTEFSLGLHTTGRFAWTLQTTTCSGPPRRGSTISIDANTGKEIARSDWTMFTPVCHFGIVVRVPVLLEGGVSATIQRRIDSTVITYE